MRIRIAFLLALSASSLLFACGGGSPTAPTTVTPAPVANPAPTPAPAPTPSPAPTPAPTPPGITLTMRAGSLPTRVSALDNGSKPAFQERVRDFTAEVTPVGNLTVRRRITRVGCTPTPVTRLRFRVIDLDTFPVPPGFADLRQTEKTSKPVIMSADLPIESDLTASFHCTAEGTTDDGQAISAATDFSVPFADAQPRVVVCVPDSKTMCLLNGNVEVKVTFVDPSGRPGVGNVMADTVRPDSGAFWYFNDRQVELTVAALNCASSIPAGYFSFFVRAETPFPSEVSVRNVSQGTHYTYNQFPVNENCQDKK